jgi:uncharacterized membrane protein
MHGSYQFFETLTVGKAPTVFPLLTSNYNIYIVLVVIHLREGFTMWMLNQKLMSVSYF